MVVRVAIFIFFSFITHLINGQTLSNPTEGDTIKINTDSVVNQHSVKKAVILSAALPGLGQAYNKKYWKMPLIYAALGTTIYFAIDNHREYRIYSDGYDKLVDDDIDLFDGRFRPSDLIVIQNDFRQARDLMIILTTLGYALNLLDAYVDAHLFYYDMSENLSVKFLPFQQETPLPYVTLGFQAKLILDPINKSKNKFILDP